MSDVLYKVVEADQWRQAQADHVFAGSAADLEDGYIHLSTAAQLPRTLARFFAGRDDLILVSLMADRLGKDLRWDRASDGESWPHLYGTIRTADVLAASPIRVDREGNVVGGN
jgi:uncharacterized protein (DUF952 family)